ncbi:MAG: hypothetical protein ACI9FN_000464 [Saprospiraceae bacterium]|jgi:hypothetical protein
MKNLATSKYIISLIVIVSILAWSQVYGQNKRNVDSNSKEFKEYWYAGEAELTRYELQQARYGEVHKGDAVLIFVTEDFDTKNQVKHEHGDNSNATPILKLNFTKKFFTGIYPYSMMSSTFSPVNGNPTIKVTTSTQEWCGHTFSQLNLKNNEYKGRLHSYFQDEGDQEFSLDAVLLEDEIWTKIRLNPFSLPTGSIKLIPGTMFLRLKHEDSEIQKAIATSTSFKNPALSKKSLSKYRLEYQDIERVLEITFEEAFPYNILLWEETNKSGFGSNAKIITTRAVRTHSIKTAYWNQHDLSDANMRKKLGLDLNNY